MTPRRAQGGFNLIEIVITIVIVALLAVLGMPTYSAWLQNSQMRASAESMIAGLQHARSEAIRLNDTQGVRFSLAGNEWSVFRVSDPATILQRGGGLDLAKNALVTPNPATTEVTYTPLGMTNPSVTVDLDVTHVDSANKCVADGGEIRCLRVQVRAGGMVRVCDPSVLAVGDPRLCLP